MLVVVFVATTVFGGAGVAFADEASASAVEEGAATQEAVAPAGGDAGQGEDAGAAGGDADAAAGEATQDADAEPDGGAGTQEAAAPAGEKGDQSADDDAARAEGDEAAVEDAAQRPDKEYNPIIAGRNGVPVYRNGDPVDFSSSPSASAVDAGATPKKGKKGMATQDVPEELEGVTVTSITPGTTAAAVIGDSGEPAWFSFTPAASGMYRFTSMTEDGSEDTDPYLSLHDSAMNILAEDDDGAGYPNFELTMYLVAGQTYYYEAKLYDDGGPGAYTVSLDAATGCAVISGAVKDDSDNPLSGVWVAAYRFMEEEDEEDETPSSWWEYAYSAYTDSQGVYRIIVTDTSVDYRIGFDGEPYYSGGYYTEDGSLVDVVEDEGVYDVSCDEDEQVELKTVTLAERERGDVYDPTPSVAFGDVPGTTEGTIGAAVYGEEGDVENDEYAVSWSDGYGAYSDHGKAYTLDLDAEKAYLFSLQPYGNLHIGLYKGGEQFYWLEEYYDDDEETGYYKFRPEESGTYTVLVTAEDWESSAGFTLTVDYAPDDEQIGVGSVSGAVTDGDSAPLEGIEVTAWRWYEYSGDVRSSSNEAVITDESGAYSFSGLESDIDYRFGFSDPNGVYRTGYYTSDGLVDSVYDADSVYVGEGQTACLETVTMQPDTYISGTVTVDDVEIDNIYDNIQVGASYYDSESDGWNDEGYGGNIGEDGAFRIGGLHEDAAYRLWVSCGFYVDSYNWVSFSGYVDEEGNLTYDVESAQTWTITGGESVSDVSITIDLVDGDAPGSPQAITANSTAPAVISEAGGRAWFSFTPDEDGWYAFSSDSEDVA
jgi:hypothetical protein